MLKKTVLLSLAIATFLTSGCLTSAGKQDFDAEQANRALDAALARSVIDEDGGVYRNAVIYVDVPGENFTYTGAAGVARADTGESMTVDYQFFVASVGKSMTAVVALQLWEEGALGENGLDATLEELEAFPPGVLDELHVIDGVSYGRQITVRHLLNQTSGLKHVLNDGEEGVGDDYPEYRGHAPGSLNHLIIYDEEKGFEAMMRCVHEGIPEGCGPENYYLSHTWRHWDYEAWLEDPTDKMAGLLNFYLSGMNRTALWRPGEDFYYADTNYIILGLLIEKLTGNSLHHELRTRIFDPLGMDHTYMGYATDPPADRWAGRLSDHWGAGFPLISSGVNLSTDWAGGGEVSTAGDLNTFIRALANGELFEREATLDEMLKLPEVHDQPYAAGIVVWPADGGLLLHHNGSCGSWIEYHTAHDISIVGTINDLDRPDRLMTLHADIYGALESAGLRSAALRTGFAGGPLATMAWGGEPAVIPMIVLAVSLILFLSALTTWPVGALLDRRKERRSPDGARSARWLAAATIVWDLLFLIAFIMSVMSNPMQLMFGLLPLARAVLLLPFVSIVLTIGLLTYTALAWRYGYWHAAGRVHYTLVALSAVGFLWFLGQFRLLGVL